jgi:hypothetical protein
MNFVKSTFIESVTGLEDCDWVVIAKASNKKIKLLNEIAYTGG